MKNIINIKRLGTLVMIFSVLCLTSCEKFLDSKPISQSSIGDFYKTKADFEQALVGAYSGFAQVYQGNGYFSLLTDLHSDNTTELTLGGDGNQAKKDIDQFTLTPDNEHVTAFWENSYTLIQRVNAILAQIDGSPLDQTEKDQFTGQAKTLRALSYFNMVRLWGGVPLVTEPVTDIDASYKQARATVDEVYTQIIADLNDASALLPVSYDESSTGKATQGAALSLLGEVYLTRKQYDDAVVAFKKVIDLGVYSLLDNYADLYKANMQGNPESIWQAQYQTGAAYLGSNLPNHFAPTGSQGVLTATGGSYGFNQPTGDIADAYAEGDTRRNNVADGYTNSDGDFVAAKYIRYYVEREVGNGYLDSGADWYVIRYADVLLMYAEALNEANNGPESEAYNSLKLVMERADLLPLSGLTYDSFKEAVYEQERLESPFEGHRWFNLLRTGRALSVMNSKVSSPGSGTTVGISKPIEEFQLLYPIPAIAVTTSAPAIVQNDGY